MTCHCPHNWANQKPRTHPWNHPYSNTVETIPIRFLLRVFWVHPLFYLYYCHPSPRLSLLKSCHSLPGSYSMCIPTSFQILYTEVQVMAMKCKADPVIFLSNISTCFQLLLKHSTQPCMVCCLLSTLPCTLGLLSVPLEHRAPSCLRTWHSLTLSLTLPLPQSSVPLLLQISS